MTMPPLDRPGLLIDGGLTLILGEAGAGKSHVAAIAAAGVTLGCERERRPGRVLYINREDDGSAVVERLTSAGAVLERVALSQAALPQIPQAAGELGAALVVIDPLNVAESGLADLATLLAWAARTGTPILATAYAWRLPDGVQRMARAVFLASRVGDQRVLTTIGHVSATIADQAFAFTVRPARLWPLGAEPLPETPNNG